MSLSGISGILVVNQLLGTNPIGRTLELFSVFLKQENKRKIVVSDMIDEYNQLHNDE